MNNYQGLCIPIDAEIAAAARLLEQNLQKICLVVHDGILVGTVTDGDIRRGLLNGKAITDAVSDIMNREPRTISSDRPRSEVQKLMIDYQLRYIPVVSDAGVLTDLISDDELVRGEGRHDNWVVLMAGGLGERLRPLTEKTPSHFCRLATSPCCNRFRELHQTTFP